MADVAVTIAGRDHVIQCRDGEEAHVRLLAERLNQHADVALRASGGLSAERTMLFLALIMADSVIESERSPPTGVSPLLLERIADRLEAVAATLEETPATS